MAAGLCQARLADMYSLPLSGDPLTSTMPSAISAADLPAQRVAVIRQVPADVVASESLPLHEIHSLSTAARPASVCSAPTAAPPQNSMPLTSGSHLSHNKSLSKPPYACVFCSELGIVKTCTRRNDLRRHINQFHNTNSQWLCQYPRCGMAFDWQTAYQIHLRSKHKDAQVDMEESKVGLCPQTVFACGYEGCDQVFEANDDLDASETWKVYNAHIIRHSEQGCMGLVTGEWSYSQRMRNLLRQSALDMVWATSSLDVDLGHLQWDQASTSALCKLLGTRHFFNMPKLLDCILVLGESPRCIEQMEVDFDRYLPVRTSCPAALSGHRVRNTFLTAQSSLFGDVHSALSDSSWSRLAIGGLRMPPLNTPLPEWGVSHYDGHEDHFAPMLPSRFSPQPLPSIYQTCGQPPLQEDFFKPAIEQSTASTSGASEEITGQEAVSGTREGELYWDPYLQSWVSTSEAELRASTAVP